MKHVIIAGAPRSGKTTLALMLNKYGYTHYKLDSIKRAISTIYNEDNHDWEKFSPKMAYIIDVIIKENMSDTSIEEKYVLDTPHLFPKDLKLIDTSNTLVIFLGCSSISPKEEFDLIRKHDKDNYWSKKMNDEELMNMIEENIEYSKLLENECKKYNILYFDTSYDRKETLKKIEKIIIDN